MNDRLTSFAVFFKLGKWVAIAFVVLSCAFTMSVFMGIPDADRHYRESEEKGIRLAAESAYAKSVRILVRDLIAENLKALKGAPHIAFVDIADVRLISSHDRAIAFNLSGPISFVGGKHTTFDAYISVRNDSPPDNAVVDYVSVDVAPWNRSGLARRQ